MNKIFFFIISLAILFSACENAVEGERIGRKKAANEDEVIARYSARLLTNPLMQRDIEENIILNYLIDSLFDFQRTESGIYYQIEKAGEGGHPSLESKVTTHYRGAFLNGKEFDSSYKRGEPMEFSLDEVIRGWQEAMQMLKPGGKGTFIIPSHLAYGKRGYPGAIEPNSILIFDVELINFK